MWRVVRVAVPLIEKFSSSNVVRRFEDADVLEIRRERAVKPLVCFSASRGRDDLVLMTVEVKAAFLQREVQECDRFVFCWPPDIAS